MKDNILEEIKELASQLSPSQREWLRRYLEEHPGEARDTKSQLLELKGEVNRERGIRCPHCESGDIVGYGNYRGRKRYKCKDCGKTFNDLTGTPMSGTHYPEKWGNYLECMLEGKSLRKIAAELDISLPTAFYWRHKILKALKRAGFDKLEGIVETDETYFLYSEKGRKGIRDRKVRKRGGSASKRGISNEQVAVITSCDRRGNSVIDVGCLGRISHKDVNRVLGGYLDNSNTLCTDKHPTYEAFARGKGIRYEAVNLSKGQRIRERFYHIQTVNSLHSRLKKWIRRFNGVATKYLSNYLNWFRILEKLKNKLDKEKEMVKYTLRNPEIMTIPKIGLGELQFV